MISKHVLSVATHGRAQDFGQPTSLCCVLLMNRCPSSKTRAGGHWVEVEEWVQEIVLEFRDQQSEQGWALADHPEVFGFPVEERQKET